MIVSVDHGNKSVKTPHFLFTSGIIVSEDKPASKKFFKKFSKRRLLAGSERLCVRLVSGKGETHLIPPGKGVKRWI